MRNLVKSGLSIGLTIGLTLSFALASPVFADGFDTNAVRASISAGQLDEAYHASQDEATLDGYLLAGESLMTKVMIGLSSNPKSDAKTVRGLAEKALAIDPNNQDARFTQVMAASIIARETSPISAFMKKLPQKTFAAIQAYRADFPEDARGDALLGGWHLAVVRKIGEKDAQKMFGANLEDGLSVFELAMTKSPQDPTVAINYAFSLLALKDKDVGDRRVDLDKTARDLLQKMNDMPLPNYLFKVVQNYGYTALQRLDDRAFVQSYAEDFLDGKRPK